MSKEQYLRMCEQTNMEIDWDKCPEELQDFPEIVLTAMNVFHTMGDRIFPDIGYIGKDYTNLDHYIDVFGIDDKEYFMSILSWLDSRMIKKSSDEMKKQHDKLKRQSSGSKRDQTPYQGRR